MFFYAIKICLYLDWSKIQFCKSLYIVLYALSFSYVYLLLYHNSYVYLLRVWSSIYLAQSSWFKLTYFCFYLSFVIDENWAFTKLERRQKPYKNALLLYSLVYVNVFLFSNYWLNDKSLNFINIFVYLLSVNLAWIEMASLVVGAALGALLVEEAKKLYALSDIIKRLHKELEWMQCFLEDVDNKQQGESGL